MSTEDKILLGVIVALTLCAVAITVVSILIILGVIPNATV